MKKSSLIILVLSIFLTTFGCGLYKKADVKDVPVNVNDRVANNIKEGKGIRFGKDKNANGGTFDFASSNALWRASTEILDFVPFTNASYSGGLLITDWFDGNTAENEIVNRQLKITVKFLSNEIRADALKINIHEKICNAESRCKTSKIVSKLEGEIKIAILKKAAFLERKSRSKKSKEYKKPITIIKKN